jgi:hypothetical protein
LYTLPNTFTFGRYELILNENFDRCSEIIEKFENVGWQKES